MSSHKSCTSYTMYRAYDTRSFLKEEKSSYYLQLNLSEMEAKEFFSEELSIFISGWLANSLPVNK